jgi:hypothetical protein
MGINVQQLMAQDPETLQRQAYMREMQQLNPSGSAAGAIGAVLGRGIGNVTQGRGFFQTNDAGLQRVAQAQSIYNEVMRDFDPEDPAASLTVLSRRLADAGLAEPAMLAAQEAAKYGAQRRAEKRAEYRDDPYAMIEDAMALPEDDPKRSAMLNRASRAISKENYDIAIREANLKKAEKDEEKGRISTLYQTEDGKPLTERPDGTLVTQDGRRYTGTPKVISRTQSPYAGLLGSNPTDVTTATAPKKGTPVYNPKTGKIEYTK